MAVARSWPTSRRRAASGGRSLRAAAAQPKLHGAFERANRTHTEEFYEITAAEPTVAALRVELRAWGHTYNFVRPHQALGYLTPAEYLVWVGIKV